MHVADTFLDDWGLLLSGNLIHLALAENGFVE
jgi:hypothetical protein